jgi:uncharacterized protein (TIGR01777 family)
VTGATGFVGTALCAELLRRGHQVVALSRDPRRAQARLPGVVAVAWGDAPSASDPLPSSSDPGAEAWIEELLLRRLSQGVRSTPLPPVDAVIHLAGENVAGRWNDAKKQRIRESRVAGTRRLVEAIRQATPRPAVLLSASAVGYYGDRGEEQLTEAASPGSDFLAEVCRAWEAEAGRAEEMGVRVARLRLGIVLDRDGGALAPMLTPFRMGAGGPMGSGRQWFPWVHRADVVGLFLFALENAQASGPINVVAPGIVRSSEFAHALGRALHRPAFLPAPAFALRLLLGEFADSVLASQRVLPARALELGYGFQYPQLEPALQAIVGREGS